MPNKRVFPEYAKLDIDKEVWPISYWESSRICQTCGICWPSNNHFTISPCCGDKTELDEHNAPDMRWPDAVTSLLDSRFNALYEKYNAGTTDEELAWEENKQHEAFDFEAANQDLEHSRL